MDVPVNYSTMPQPIFKLSMPLEPHGNADFKTGAGSEFSSKNVGVMAKKLKLIWNQNCWVFWAIHVQICGFQRFSQYWNFSFSEIFHCFGVIWPNFFFWNLSNIFGWTYVCLLEGWHAQKIGDSVVNLHVWGSKN